MEIGKGDMFEVRESKEEFGEKFEIFFFLILGRKIYIKGKMVNCS